MIAVKKEIFIPVTKDSEIIHVCPEQVEHHRTLGWNPVIAELETEEATPPPQPASSKASSKPSKGK